MMTWDIVSNEYHLIAFKEIFCRYEADYKCLMVEFDDIVCNDPFITINHELRDTIDPIDDINNLQNDEINGISNGAGKESVIFNVEYSSKTPDGVFSEFTPYRDSYDLKHATKTHRNCLVNMIVSKFYPHRDSFDLKPHPIADYHDLPYRFSNEYIPHRDSFDLKSIGLNHHAVPFRFRMKFIPYQDSYDKTRCEQIRVATATATADITA